METNHTKGGWLMDCTDRAAKQHPNHLPITNQNRDIICLVNHTPGELHVREYAANANLIFAAPKMLEALVTAYNFLWNGNREGTIVGKQLRETICEALNMKKEEFDSLQKPLRLEQ